MSRLARPVLYLGLVGIVVGLAAVHAEREGYGLAATSRFPWTLVFLALLLVASYGAGLPDLVRTTRSTVTSALLAPAAAALGVSVVQLVTGSALLPRLVVFGSAAASVPWALCCVALARGGRDRAESRDRVLLVAQPAEGATLADELEANPERPAVLLDQVVPAELVPSGPRSRPLVERAVHRRANLVVLDRSALAEEAVVAQAASLHEAGVRVRTLSLFYEDWLGKLPASELERTSLLFDIREVHGGRYARVKRAVDVATGVVGALVLAVLLPVVALGNLVANRGSLFYRQPRVGKNGAVFQILKFRTMRPDAAGPTTWTTERDPRITPFGGILRRTHLDEVPQVWNIVRGDLSIVGPRPEQPQYVRELVEKLPFYDMRHLVRPGLTGWAQVKYGYAGDERDALEKLQYDFWYLRHQSLALDARIIGRTVRSVLGHQGAGR